MHENYRLDSTLGGIDWTDVVLMNSNALLQLGNFVFQKRPLFCAWDFLMIAVGNIYPPGCMCIIYSESKDLDTLYLEIGTKSRIQLQRHWSQPATSMHLVALDPWGSELLQKLGQTGGAEMEGVGKDQLSNEKRAPGCLGFVGDDILPTLYRDYFINHDVRIPIKPTNISWDFVHWRIFKFKVNSSNGCNNDSWSLYFLEGHQSEYTMSPQHP